MNRVTILPKQLQHGTAVLSLIRSIEAIQWCPFIYRAARLVSTRRRNAASRRSPACFHSASNQFCLEFRHRPISRQMPGRQRSHNSAAGRSGPCCRAFLALPSAGAGHVPAELSPLCRESWLRDTVYVGHCVHARATAWSPAVFWVSCSEKLVERGTANRIMRLVAGS